MMSGLRNFWAMAIRHSLGWTLFLMAILVWQSLRDPAYVPGGIAIAAGLCAVSAGLRTRRFWPTFLSLLFGAIGSAVFALVLLRFVLPLGQFVTVGIWDHVLEAAVVVLAVLRTAWVFRHIDAPAPAAAAGGDDSKPAPAPAPTQHPRRFRKAATTWVFASLVLGFLIYTNNNSQFVQWQISENLNIEYIPNQAETVNTDRILARVTARTVLASGKDSSSSTSTPRMVFTNSGLFWQSARYNNNYIGKILGSVESILRVPAGSSNANTVETDAPFLFGDDSWVTRGIFAARHPFSQMAEKVYAVVDGKPLLAISYRSTRPTVYGTMIPYMAGVMVVSPDGNVDDVSMEEAARKFPGLPLFSLDLAREQAAAYGWFRGGWWDVMWDRKKLQVIAEDLSNDPNANKAPYIMRFVDYGLQETLILKADGAQNDEATEQMYFDTITGKVRVWIVPRDQKVWSPTVAVPDSRKADASIDVKEILKVEPKPIVIVTDTGERKPFYLISVVGVDANHPDKHAYVTTIWVDAVNRGNAGKVNTREDLEAWVAKVKAGK